VLVADFFVIAVHKADFTTADSDVSCGYVHVGADVTVQFAHKCLTETHDFSVGFSFGVEIGTAFGATHGQGGQCIFENLFKPQKFDDAQIHGRMKTDTAFEGADGVVELHAEPAVDMDVALIVFPGDAENDRPLRLHDSLVDVGLHKFRMPFGRGFQRLQDLFHGLVEFGLMGIDLFYLCNDIFDHGHGGYPLQSFGFMHFANNSQ